MQWLLSLILGGNPLDRALGTVDKYMESGVKKEETRADVVKSYLTAQAAMMSGPGWRWMMAIMCLYAVPAALHFASVCLYSMLWCRACAFPQDWSIAALPEPHATYSGWIVASFFVGAGGLQVLNKWAGRK